MENTQPASLIAFFSMQDHFAPGNMWVVEWCSLTRMKFENSRQEGELSDLIEMLSKLNRKERFFLIGQALGNKSFELSSSFRETLSDKIGARVPNSAYAAMDYHLDWIAASLQAYRDPDPAGEPYCNSDEMVTGTQLDIDLLIAFEAEDGHHLVFVEAKGYDSWDNKQLLAKAHRLKKLFGQEGDRHEPNVKPHFFLMSLRRPKKLKCEEWPQWMRDYHWLKLNLKYPRWRVTRCKSDGKSSSKGDRFCIKEVSAPTG